MGMGSTALLCAPQHPNHLPVCRRKEGVAVCREHSPSQKREVQPVFEPSWTAQTCLKEAYERLIPVKRRSLSLQKTPEKSVSVEQPLPPQIELPNTEPGRSAA
jgi:hypothetical protein